MRKEAVVFIVVSRKNRKVKESFSYLIAYLLLTAIIKKSSKIIPSFTSSKTIYWARFEFLPTGLQHAGSFFLYPIFDPLLHIKDLWFKSTFRVLHADVLQMMVPRRG